MAGDTSAEVSTEEQGTPELANHNEVASLQKDIEEKVDGLVLEPSGNDSLLDEISFLFIIQYIF